MSHTELESRQSALDVLIVEDDVHLRAALAALASREGAVPREAGTLEEARKRLAEAPLDAVLVDLTLPDGSGLGLLGAPEALGSPDGVALMFDSRQKVIGVRASPYNRRETYLLRKHPNHAGRKISAMNFCRRFKIRPDGTYAFTTADVNNEGVLVLDLNEVHSVSKTATK